MIESLQQANAGDSRALISSGGKEIPLSHDHKPTNKEELERITAAGGFVEFNRVNGMLFLFSLVFNHWKSRNLIQPVVFVSR